LPLSVGNFNDSPTSRKDAAAYAADGEYLLLDSAPRQDGAPSHTVKLSVFSGIS